VPGRSAPRLTGLHRPRLGTAGRSPKRGLRGESLRIGLRIVLNHVGGILGLGSYRSKRDEVFARWSSSIKALAARPNVFVKLGGLGQSYTSLRFDEDAEPPSSEMVAARCRPYIETCIAAFGASRCMFESNFPVDKISYSYHVFWNACKLMARGASSTEKADLFGGAAARCYRLNVFG